jgi:polysaccharide biosynthesis protein PslH
MKILNVIPYSPVPAVFGGALRIYHLLKWMTQHHDVHVLSYGTHADRERIVAEFQLSASQITMVPEPRWISERWKRLGQAYALLRNTSFTEIASRNTGMQAALDRCLDRVPFDVVQIAYPVMGFFEFKTSATRVLDAANVEYDIHRRSAEAARSRLRQLWSAYEYRKLYPQEVEICRQQDMILVTSERDKELLDRDVPGVRKAVIPNGVDTTFFSPQGTPPGEDVLIFTGAINYFPNADAVEYFITDVLPLIRQARPGVTFFVVGNAPPESIRRLASSSVIVTGYVDDVRPFIRRSAVYVVPMRIGGGTRLKVLEAMAMHRPIVTTSIGCEGIDAVHGESVLIADDARAFADATVRLLTDKALCQALVRRGEELVRSRYDWSVVGEQLSDAYAVVRNVPLDSRRVAR